MMSKETKAEKADRLSDAKADREADDAEAVRDAVREGEREDKAAVAAGAEPKATVRVAVIEDGHTVIREIEKK